MSYSSVDTVCPPTVFVIHELVKRGPSLLSIPTFFGDGAKFILPRGPREMTVSAVIFRREQYMVGTALQ